MSGFEFHLRCDACELTSPTYPFRFDRVVRPDRAILPVVDRADKRFDTARIEVPGILETPELTELAAAFSSADRTICVPHMHAEAPRIEPHVTCPRCGADAVRAMHGHPPRIPPVVEAIEPIVRESRELVPGTAREWMLGSRARIYARRSGGSGDAHDATTYDWKVTRPDGVAAAESGVASVVAALTAALEQCGSTVEPPRVRRAFTDLVEHRAADEPT